ncbi:hypothetical protein NB710_000192 [Xanthomonas sacchari]|nr:hypothetical protein [Xanthomonas sacchari]
MLRHLYSARVRSGRVGPSRSRRCIQHGACRSHAIPRQHNRHDQSFHLDTPAALQRKPSLPVVACRLVRFGILQRQR